MESDVKLPPSDHLLSWFETHRKQALWGAVAILAAGLVIGFFLWQKDQKEVDAAEALTALSVPHTTGMAERKDAADAYLNIANKYPDTKAGVRALLLAGGEYFTDGKIDQAKTAFEKFRREHGDTPLMGQALLGIAACLQAQGKSAEAMSAYKDITERRPTDVVVPQAKFALAVLYEAQGKPELAFATLEELMRTEPYSSIGNEAGMKAEELKQKYPKLAEPPPSPTNRPPMISIPTTNSAAPGAPTLKPVISNAPGSPVPKTPPPTGTNPAAR